MEGTADAGAKLLRGYLAMGTQAATNIHKQALLAGKPSASLGHLQVQTSLRRPKLHDQTWLHHLITIREMSTLS